MTHVQHAYFQHYAMTVYVIDIGVLRRDKFLAG